MILFEVEEKGSESPNHDDLSTLRYPECSHMLGENASLGLEEGQPNLILAA